MRTKSTINKLILTLLSSFLFFAFSFQLQAQSVDLLDKEAGYKDFKLGQVISDVSAYQLDAKRSTEELTAYIHKGDCCTEFKGLNIDGVMLYLDNTNQLNKIEFVIEQAISLPELGQHLSKFQNHYGSFSDLDIAKGDDVTSSFFWKTEEYELVLKITAIDDSKQKYKAELIFSKI